MIDRGSSIYVHVPFCKHKCGYCDFNSYELAGASTAERFLDALDRELGMRTLPREPISIFIGGGTPTHLDERRFQMLFDVLGRHLDLPACKEVTMEGNPESVTAAKASIALEAGVNRISLGAQSFDAKHLQFLERSHDAEQIATAVAAVRATGFANMSLDMIFGMPGQSPAEWEQDLRTALELNPDHLSCYQLTFEPGTKLTRDHRQGRVSAIDESACRDMFLATREILAEAGYNAYEVSNFAGRGGPCRHNDHYWLQGDYIGVGPGAASHRQGVRSTNLKALEAWVVSIDANLEPSGEAETLSPRQRIGEAIWLGLRRSEGIDLDALSDRFGLGVKKLVEKQARAQIEAGMLISDDAQLRLSETGLLYADEITAKFLTGP